MIECVYAFCSSIHLRVSGLFWSSSQRYGSVMLTPCKVSLTSTLLVSGGLGTFLLFDGPAQAPVADARESTTATPARRSFQTRIHVLLWNEAGIIPYPRKSCRILAPWPAKSSNGCGKRQPRLRRK